MKSVESMIRIITYSMMIFDLVRPEFSINIGGKKSGRYVTIKKRMIERVKVIPKNKPFLTLLLLDTGIKTAAKNPKLPKVLERIHKVVARFAEVFAMKKSDIPLKLKVWKVSRAPISKKEQPRTIKPSLWDSS
jgi:hypothetical protein